MGSVNAIDADTVLRVRVLVPSELTDEAFLTKNRILEVFDHLFTLVSG